MKKIITNHQFIERVKNDLAKRRMTPLDLCKKIGMKKSTFYRNMSEEGSFTFPQILMIIKALDYSLLISENEVK